MVEFVAFAVGWGMAGVLIYAVVIPIIDKLCHRPATVPLKGKENDFFIRKLNERDLPDVRKLMEQLSPVAGECYRNSMLVANEARKVSGIKTFVAEDGSFDKCEVFGVASLIIEQKFSHDCGKVGHIEDVVVGERQRARGIGQSLVQHLIAEAKAAGCYKVILNCSLENTGFYVKAGFRVASIGMRLDLRD